MQHIQPSEVKARLVALLRAVARGKRREAVERFQRRRVEWQGATMTRDEILAARHEGHHPSPA